jgi:hypothetical protein
MFCKVLEIKVRPACGAVGFWVGDSEIAAPWSPNARPADSRPRLSPLLNPLAYFFPQDDVWALALRAKNLGEHSSRMNPAQPGVPK